MESYTWQYIKTHPKETRKLLGITYEQLMQLISQAKLLKENQRVEREKTKVRLNKAGGGHPGKLNEEEQIVLMLVYLRHHLSFQLLGILFQVSESTAHKLFEEWNELLSEALPASLLEQVKKQELSPQENESTDLIGQVEAYHQRMGCYPESVHVDKIYRTRANRAWCKERGIRLSGPPLGRPPKNLSAERKRIEREDEKIRNAIEGKFGQGKRRISLNRILTKLKETSETAIALTFLVMNLVAGWRQVNCLFFCANFANLRLRKPADNRRLLTTDRSLILAYQLVLQKSSSNGSKLVA